MAPQEARQTVQIQDTGLRDRDTRSCKQAHMVATCITTRQDGQYTGHSVKKPRLGQPAKYTVGSQAEVAGRRSSKQTPASPYAEPARARSTHDIAVEPDIAEASL